MTLANRLYRVDRGKDSIIEIVIQDEGKAVDSTQVTRCDLVFKRSGVADISFSSSVDASWFTLSDPEEVDGLDVNVIEINLRQLPDPPAAGRYRVDVHLWDSEYVNGRFWGTIDVEVRDAPPSP